MSSETILIMLFIISAVTTLFVEGEKNFLKSYNKEYAPNLLAAYTSIIISICVYIGYVILFDIAMTPKTFVYMCIVTALSWLISQTSFDKVKQMIEQIKLIKR